MKIFALFGILICCADREFSLEWFGARKETKSLRIRTRAPGSVADVLLRICSSLCSIHCSRLSSNPGKKVAEKEKLFNYSMICDTLWLSSCVRGVQNNGRSRITVKQIPMQIGPSQSAMFSPILDTRVAVLASDCRLCLELRGCTDNAANTQTGLRCEEILPVWSSAKQLPGIVCSVKGDTINHHQTASCRTESGPFFSDWFLVKICRFYSLECD